MSIKGLPFHYKLNELTNGEFSKISNLLGDNIDYTELGKKLMKQDNITSTQYGVYKIDEHFEHFLGKDIELTHDF